MDTSIVIENAGRLYDGFKLTLSLVGLSVICAALITVPLVLGLRSKAWAPRVVSQTYLTFFRGSPLLAQLFLLYYGSGQFRPLLEDLGVWWLFRDAFFCSVLAFALNSAAYTAALVKGAIDGLPAGQWEAATALGLGRFATLRRVIMPQAIGRVLPGYGNEIVLLIKASSITMAVTIYELLGVVKVIYSRTFDISIYIWAALIYIFIVSTVRLAFRMLERSFFRW
ncbi:ABC transporter permease subunit [uncultured Roseibium sp.]|uniref:ABC transporter permease n=1 Tax=uncultured Roseibium sp. TaxID=1936171 RepID=UPI002622E99F|nr:ABC transporter permease subunit [uncultured Roseibium sp.]